MRVDRWLRTARLFNTRLFNTRLFNTRLFNTRLFNTRAPARAAVRGGRVHVNGAAVKPSREVAPG